MALMTSEDSVRMEWRQFVMDLESLNPVVPSADHLHLFVSGGESGRFSAFIPGWGHMSEPVLRSIDGQESTAELCTDESCSV